MARGIAQDSLPPPIQAGDRSARRCEVDNDDCTTGAQIEARGWCSLHYQRWQAHGDPLWTREPSACSVGEDCTVGGKLSRGLCVKHYWRLMKFGDPLKTEELASCSRCGGPMRPNNRYGVCQRNPDCKAERNRISARNMRKDNPGRAAEASKRFLDSHPLDARIAIALNSARTRARKSGIPFSLSKGDLPALPERCPVLGIPLVIWGSKDRNESPSLDRIVPSLGYVPGNIRWISTRANILRRDATALELTLVAEDAMRLERGTD